MPIRFRCQDCRSRVKVPEGSQGKQVKCPRCGRIQSVPRHHNQQNAHPEANGLTVHTCVGSMHRAPKRKEALVGAGVETPPQANGYTNDLDTDRFSDSASTGGGVPGGLDLPEPSSDDTEFSRPQRRVSRKERRRQAARAREAQRQRDAMAAQQDSADLDTNLAESRKQVEDLFATAQGKDFSNDEPAQTPTDEPVTEPVVEKAAHLETPAAASTPKAIALTGAARIDHETAEAPTPIGSGEAVAARHDAEATPPPAATPPQRPTPSEPNPGWSFDLTSEAYPFLRIIPWVLRITALMLIGPAFKLMLMADAQGFSGVASMLILFAGLALVVVTWTVGEIATAVRDIALRKATG